MKKIAIVGLGNIAGRHLRNIKALYPEMQTIAVSSSGRSIDGLIENADKVIDMASLLEERPDYAIICSPATFHARHASHLATLGIPLLIEKPIAADVAMAEQLQELARKSLPLVAVGYCLRFMPSAAVIKQLLEENAIGEIFNVMASVGQYLPDWRKGKDYRSSVSVSKALGGGVLLELSHELDYLQWLLGSLTYKYAELRNTSELALEVEEIADLVLATDKGAICYLHMDFLQKQPQRQCVLIGSQGRIEWNLLENSVYVYRNGKAECLYAEPQWDKNEMYLSMLKDFIEPEPERTSVRSSVSEAVGVVRLIDVIKNNAVWGRS